MLDPIFLASVAAKWALNKLLDRLKDSAIKALLSTQQGLRTEVQPLIEVLDRANLVLGGVTAGIGIGIDDDKRPAIALEIKKLQVHAVMLAKHLDVLEYDEINKKIIKKKSKSSNKIKAKLQLITGQSNTTFESSYIKNLRVAVQELHTICDGLDHAILVQKITELGRITENKSTDTRETVQNFTETKDFPREEKSSILGLIREDRGDQELLVIPIVGVGGVGKTTLAKQVYNDPGVKAEFHTMIWIYVSANFNEVKLSQGILEQVPESEHKNSTNLNVLQRDIMKHLTKRFLLVLDDMWEEREGRWDKLLAPLRFKPDKGNNVILVTTRKFSVANITSKTEKHIKLDGMEEVLFWRFFKTCIFGDESYEGNNMLQDIAKEIATKLNGNPLAAKTVGSLLKRKVYKDYWINIKDSDEWKLDNEVDDIIPALRLSYNHLPYEHQLLFSYCALFPKGYRFDKGKLIRMWIALGFVVHERKKLEDAGSDSFDILVARSFFQEDGHYFVVHDLMHDVAQDISVFEYLTVDASKARKVFTSVTHVGIWTGIEPNDSFDERKLDTIQNNDILKSLESLMLVGAYDKNFSDKFVKILEQLNYVRILRLSAVDYNAGILLSCVKKFIHLRYLELSYTSDEHKPLPKAICKLYHLMVLDIIHWRGLNELPEGIHNLVNLRYLLVPGSGSLHSKISRVGELKLLQQLNEFQVQEKSGFKISELEHLNEIKGSLSILDLENVKDKKEASGARIQDKEHLSTLSLSWGAGGASKHTAIQTEVIEGLKPQKYLAHLHVINYSGATPSWLEALTYLEILQLQDCTAMQVLPPFKKLPYLKKLSLIGMSSLKEVKIDFNYGGASEEDKLELSEVEIAKCSALTSIRLHSCKALTELNIIECEALFSLNGLPSSGQLICKIKGCPQLPADMLPEKKVPSDTVSN